MRVLSLLTTTIVSLVLLSGCGSTDPVELVKGGTLDFDNTVTVGNAFQGYEYISNPTWTTFETGQGRTIVEMTAGIDPADYSGTMIPGVWEINDETAQFLNKHGKFSYKVQFAIGQDGESFQVHFAGINAHFEALQTNEIPDEDLETIAAAYNNQPSETVKASFFVIAQALVQNGIE